MCPHHRLSPLSDKSDLSNNCGTIPERTGLHRNRKKRREEADVCFVYNAEQTWPMIRSSAVNAALLSAHFQQHAAQQWKQIYQNPIIRRPVQSGLALLVLVSLAGASDIHLKTVMVL
jgi:hypothetical protein